MCSSELSCFWKFFNLVSGYLTSSWITPVLCFCAVCNSLGVWGSWPAAGGHFETGFVMCWAAGPMSQPMKDFMREEGSKTM